MKREIERERERRGVSLGTAPALSHVSWGIEWLHTKPPSGSQCVHVPVSGLPGLKIFPHFANVAQVLQPEPPRLPSSTPGSRSSGQWTFEGVYVCVFVCVKGLEVKRAALLDSRIRRSFLAFFPITLTQTHTCTLVHLSH